MNKLSNREMIEHLARFRDAGDKLSDDIFDISLRIFDIISSLEGNVSRNAEEADVLSKLQNMSGILMEAALHANEYNDSMWKDYTKVIKALGDSKGAKPNV